MWHFLDASLSRYLYDTKTGEEFLIFLALVGIRYLSREILYGVDDVLALHARFYSSKLKFASTINGIIAHNFFGEISKRAKRTSLGSGVQGAVAT